jgi:hypothetical protein
MGIEDELGAIWAHLDPAAQVAAVDKALADLEALPEAAQVQALAAVGKTTAEKRAGAEIIAGIRAVAKELAPLGLMVGI